MSGWWLAGMAAALLVASEVASAEPPTFEASGFGAYRVGGDFDTDEEGPDPRSVDLEEGGSWGVGAGIYRDPDSFYEFLYSRQETRLDRNDYGPGAPDITLEYYQLGGTLLLGDNPRMRPYVSLTVGATRLNADGYSAETEFSMSFGTGLRMPLTAHLDVTAGLRGYLTFVDQDTRLFCSTINGEGACLLNSSGSTILQVEAGLGLTFRF
ncbi:outer membrane beta-barrel protein [Thioalkalivibrio sp. XN279]|uniref:outer membrane beta-barrel protein n=1 Tax=Thioalkalivibrio sp. XN279 TaxID=2714953 RepID=UPI0014087A5D|nr:outer membrane beta-barrel protein [Thioalkalivibrio sp. XN279]NHA14209.1 porin family protein [Thioalkalivibrio sp. XN279]